MWLTVLKTIDVLFLIGFFAALVWLWRHKRALKRVVLQNDAMPRESSRGLIYGLLLFLLGGFIMVHLYWLF